jgi:galactitol-specific phosphotransferase system IIB component
VAERLKFDGNDLEPVFAFENQAGGVLFGTWRDFKVGQIFTAQALASDVPGMPSDWGISKNDIVSASDTNGRFDYAVLRAVGMGDGMNFSPSGAKRTISLWIDIPVAYQDKGETRSGLASVYYRGPVDSYPDAKALIDTILNGMNATQVTLISVAEFKNRMAFKQALPSSKPAANSAVPSPVPAQKVEVVNSGAMSKEIKQKIINKLENLKREIRELEILIAL